MIKKPIAYKFIRTSFQCSDSQTKLESILSYNGPGIDHKREGSIYGERIIMPPIDLYVSSLPSEKRTEYEHKNGIVCQKDNFEDILGIQLTNNKTRLITKSGQELIKNLGETEKYLFETKEI